MRALALIALVACELEPPPKQAPHVAALESAPACADAAEKFAAVLVATAADGVERAALERDRAQLVRQRTDECSASKWSPDAIACYAAARARVDLDACLKMTRH